MEASARTLILPGPFAPGQREAAPIRMGWHIRDVAARVLAAEPTREVGSAAGHAARAGLGAGPGYLGTGCSRLRHSAGAARQRARHAAGGVRRPRGGRVLGARRDGAPPGRPGPVEEHGGGGREQRGAERDHGDLPARHAACGDITDGRR